MEQKNYILKVVPLQPLPPQTPDFFLYFSGKKISHGSLVKIEIRKKEKIGYVWKTNHISEVKYLIKNLDYQIKGIKDVITEKDIFSEIQKKIAYKISRRYYLSLSSALSLFFNFSKTYINFNLPQKINVVNRKFKLEIWKRINWEKLNNKKVIIILPTQREADNFYFQNKDKKVNLIYLKNLKNLKSYIDLIVSPEKNIFLGSKKIIFLPWQNIDKIIVLKEGSPLYREFFKNPKINYLEIIEDLAKLLKCYLIYSDDFYTLSVYLKFPQLKYPKVEFTPFQSINQLKKIIQEDNRLTKIFILQKNLAQRLICSNCFYKFDCQNCQNYLTVYENNLFCPQCHKNYPFPALCPKCQNSNLIIKEIGKEWLKKFLNNQKINFFEIQSESQFKKFKQFKNKKGVIIGSWLILNIFSPKTIFMNFDKAFFSDNLVLKEKYLHLLYLLKNSSAQLFLQTKLNQEILNKIKNGIIIKELIEERRLNKLPPFYSKVKLISRLSNLQELNRRLLSLKDLLKKRILLSKKEVEITGPFLERISRIKKRYQMYLQLKSKNFIDLKNLLEGVSCLEEINFDDDL
ncbi:MAG: hypothetical protein NZ866_00380 [Patescibacteria group bacterium]|nr:hypothetical protein [Patescibacteria group bacterium]